MLTIFQITDKKKISYNFNDSLTVSKIETVLMGMWTVVVKLSTSVWTNELFFFYCIHLIFSTLTLHTNPSCHLAYWCPHIKGLFLAESAESAQGLWRLRSSRAPIQWSGRQPLQEAPQIISAQPVGSPSFFLVNSYLCAMRYTSLQNIIYHHYKK